MSIPAVCQFCGHRFQAPDSFAGKRVKCKHCGQIFQIPNPEEALTAPTADAPPDAGGVDLDTLARLDGGAATEATQPDQAAFRGSFDEGEPPPGRIGPKHEKVIHAGADTVAYDLSGPAEPTARANVLHFRYPGARLLDQWLPTVLIVGCVGWLAAAASSGSHDNPTGIAWVKCCRFAIPLLLYWAVIFPLTMVGIRAAGRALRYRMPPGPKFRAFGCFFPAFTLGVVLWWVGEGRADGLVLGVVVGLIISCIFYWLLFRLREDEIPTSCGYAAGGFAGGLVVAALLLVGLNAATDMGVVQAKAQAKAPASPFGPGLAWVPPPPAELPPMLKPKTKPAPSQAAPTEVAESTETTQPAAPPPPPAKPHPASPVLSDLQPALLPAPYEAILQPTSPAPYLGLLHHTGSTTLSVTGWDLSAGHALANVVQPSDTLGQPALSTDGARCGWISTFPRRVIWVASFASGRNIARLDIDPDFDNPQLLGFCSPSQLMVFGHGGDRHPVIELQDSDQPKAVAKKLVLPDSFSPDDTSTSVALNVAHHRLVVEARIDRVPTLLQFDTSTGQPIQPSIAINEIDRNLPGAFTGLAYSADASHVAVLFEHGADASLDVYDTATGANTAEIDRAGGLIPGLSHENYTGNTLAPAAPGAWVVFGQAIMDDTAPGGNIAAQLLVQRVVGQRMLDNNVIQFVIAEGGGQHVALGTLDLAALEPLLAHPPTPTAAATQP